MVAHDLAVQAGIQVPEARLERFSEAGSTYLVRRFDRAGSKGRIHYASAMTLLGKTDGYSSIEGASYLDMAELIVRSGAEPDRDLAELWKRIVFNIAVSNTDDHLRNHGFLLSPSGWIISPAFDVNPEVAGTALRLNINEYDNSTDVSLALHEAPRFHLEEKDAVLCIEQIRNAVSSWRDAALKYGISRAEIDYMASAFGSEEYSR